MTHHYIRIGLLMALSIITNTAFAITSISGTITEDTTLTAANGPYRIVGQLKVAPGATLTIEGGITAEGDANGITFLSNLLKSHATHFDQSGKGPGITECNTCHNAKFKDNLPLETTTVCDGCHSPGGSFPEFANPMDPDVGNKANFRTGGVYENDGVTLKPGKEKWCSTCHDSEPSVNDLNGSVPTYAPNVVGDNTTYGFWVTGHGKSIGNCLECHDAGKDHWDFNQRTYEIDEANNSRVVNGWGDSYRLRTANTKASEQFCIKCHDRGALQDEGGQSNFKDQKSGHDYHIWGAPFQVVRWADTDYDGLQDAKPACTTCHNPHGSKSNKMTRTGELASTLGTTDREPGLNQTYVKPASGPFSTATWQPNLPNSGTYGVYVWWKLGTLLETEAKYTINHDGGSDSIVISQNNDGDRWVYLGSYTFQSGSAGSVVLSADFTKEDASLIADKMGFDGNSDGIPDIIIDDADPEFSSINLLNGGAAWSYNSWASARLLSNEERFEQDVTLAESTAGYARFNPDGGNNVEVHNNNVCHNCHGEKVYYRTPFMGPKVLNRFEEQRWALNDGNGVAHIVVSVTDPDDDMAGGTVTIDASSLGGGSADAMTDNGDGTFSYQLSIPQGTFDKAYNLPITAIDSSGNVATGTTSVYVRSSADTIYMDNIDAIYTSADNWQRPPIQAQAYNGYYISTQNFSQFPDYDSELTGIWKPTIEKAGSYHVYVWLYGSYLFNQNATYTVEDRDGTTNVYVNQENGPVNGGWVSLGTFNYDAGSTASITVSGSGISTWERLYVDAIKLELVP